MSLLATILSHTDPLSAVILAGILFYVRMIRRDMTNELRRNRKRIARMETEHFNDGD